MKRPTPWHMASVRQRQAPRRYRPVAPVGEKPPADWQDKAFTDDVERIFVNRGGERWGACKVCGYAVCSCPPKRPAAEAFGGDGFFRPEPGVTYEFPAMPLPPKALEVQLPASWSSPTQLSPELSNGPLSNASPMPVPEWHGNPMMRSIEGRMSLWEGLQKREAAFMTPERKSGFASMRRLLDEQRSPMPEPPRVPDAFDRLLEAVVVLRRVCDVTKPLRWHVWNFHRIGRPIPYMIDGAICVCVHPHDEAEAKAKLGVTT